MRFNRLAPIAALALTVVTTVSAQIPSGARRLGAPAVAAPKLMVATPFAFSTGYLAALVTSFWRTAVYGSFRSPTVK